LNKSSTDLSTASRTPHGVRRVTGTPTLFSVLLLGLQALLLGLPGTAHAESDAMAQSQQAEHTLATGHASERAAPHDPHETPTGVQSTPASASSAAPKAPKAAEAAEAAAPASAAVSPAFPAEAALEFEEKLDGRCYILSEGGKLVVMHNRSEAGSVRYRLVRLFADRPQMGRTTGVIGPGEEIKLGCSEVDGRRQHWRVERASFVE